MSEKSLRHLRDERDIFAAYPPKPTRRDQIESLPESCTGERL
jgi:hypothetical protein